MRNYFKKVFHILPVFLLAVFLCVSVLGIVRYFFDFKYQILNLSNKAWELFLPMILSTFALILLRKRFGILKHSNPNKDNFFYIMICAIVLCALLVNSQFYCNIKFSKNQTIQNVHQISLDKNIKHIKIKSYYVDDAYLNSKFESNVSGKYDDKLNMKFYFVAKILKDSLKDPKDDLPQVWFANNFSKTISNRLSAEKKKIEHQNFREKCYQDLAHFNFYDNAYFLRVSKSEEKDIYENLILNLIDSPQKNKTIFLSPSNGKFIDDGKSTLSWFFKILGIGILTILFALIFPNYHKESMRGKNEEDDFIWFLQVFIPKKGFFITPILIDLNILIFIGISCLGVDPFYPRTEDLVKFGALTSQFSNGEYWRIISSMFMHGGIMHLIQNMVVLGIAGFFSENIFGNRRFVLIYFLSGIIAGVSSLLWHEGNVILVGASGAIFGVIGSLAMALLLQNKFKENRVALFVIFGYFIVNLLFGLISNSDNAAHISGFICGMIISLVFYFFKE